MSELTDQAKKRYVIKISSALLKGDPGEDGKDATIDSFLPIDDVDVKHVGIIRTSELVDDLLDELLHTELLISNFISLSGNTFEIGQSLSSINVSWDLNRTPSTQVITGDNVVSPTLSPTDRSATVNFSPNLESTGIVELDVDDGLGLTGSTDSKTIALNFFNKIYCGLADIPGAINSAFILSLSDDKLQFNRVTSFTLDSGLNEYIWVAIPVAYGEATFHVGGFQGGVEPAVIVSLTNDSGHVENYYVYRSTNHNLGVTTVNVS